LRAPPALVGTPGVLGASGLAGPPGGGPGLAGASFRGTYDASLRVRIDGPAPPPGRRDFDAASASSPAGRRGLVRAGSSFSDLPTNEASEPDLTGGVSTTPGVQRPPRDVGERRRKRLQPSPPPTPPNAVPWSQGAVPVLRQAPDTPGARTPKGPARGVPQGTGPARARRILEKAPSSPQTVPATEKPPAAHSAPHAEKGPSPQTPHTEKAPATQSVPHTEKADAAPSVPQAEEVAAAQSVPKPREEPASGVEGTASGL
ncbi:hypothetical protein T484DRAFT_1669274, partial [Baffinella frigidus]